ncbi:AIG1 family protein [Entamoeba histolytica HM-3:IMSS]|uniref:AIG1 family protein n=2 Tax=Entamoeba histolytica TaxID=5759 RepID=M2RBB3_ENTHI|nr:AIG1 family protein [Entamoeba histolytica KU27]EMS13393.1 AIG1 family protein [Entamoeba histolytica HM-3:IMSS]
MKQTKLLMMGQTGHGKSSLGNFILKKNVFSVSANPDSQTNETKGCYGISDRSDIFVIDTPGFNDSKGQESQREYMNQMVDYIKKEGEGLKGIVVVLPFHEDKFSEVIQIMIRIIANTFPISGFWKHVCVVWTKCMCFYPQAVLEESIHIKQSYYNAKMMDYINQKTGSEHITFPMFFVDSNPCTGQDNSRSENEIESLLNWARKLSPIDVNKVEKRDIVYESVILEEEDQEIVISKTEKELTTQINHLVREKRFRYDEDEPSYSNWETVSSTTKVKEFPKQVTHYVTEYIYRDPPKEEKNKENKEFEDTMNGLGAAIFIGGCIVKYITDNNRRKKKWSN